MGSSAKTPSTLVIVGPTAVGKTEIAVALAEKIGGEIVSADAFQAYRGMDIATAKPDRSQRARVPHHLIDCLDISDTYSVAKFRDLALSLLPQICSRRRIPIVVGGSAMYIAGLVDGIFQAPAPDQDLRRRLEAEEREKGTGFLHRRLMEVDPLSAGRIHPNNLKRIVRALEIFEQTGIPISRLQREWRTGDGGRGTEDGGQKIEDRGWGTEDGRQRTKQKDTHCSPTTPYSPLPTPSMIGLRRDRKDLYRRIERRVEKMFEAGLVEETRRLIEQGANRNPVAWQALGYREIEGFLRGEYPLERARELVLRNTRRFAKRQLTWWRRENRIRWVDLAPEEKTEETVGKVMGTVSSKP